MTIATQIQMLVHEEERQFVRQKATYQLIPRMHQDKIEDYKLVDQSTKVVDSSRRHKNDDPQRVEAYVSDIVEHLRLKECREVRPYGYMAIQRDIDERIGCHKYLPMDLCQYNGIRHLIPNHYLSYQEPLALHLSLSASHSCESARVNSLSAQFANLDDDSLR